MNRWIKEGNALRYSSVSYECPRLIRAERTACKRWAWIVRATHLDLQKLHKERSNEIQGKKAAAIAVIQPGSDAAILTSTIENFGAFMHLLARPFQTNTINQHYTRDTESQTGNCSVQIWSVSEKSLKANELCKVGKYAQYINQHP